MCITDKLTTMLQETIVFHDLPYDCLAAWYYKQDEGSSGIEEADVMKTDDNTADNAVDNAGKSWMLQHLKCSMSQHLCSCTPTTMHNLGPAGVLQCMPQLCCMLDAHSRSNPAVMLCHSCSKTWLRRKKQVQLSIQRTPTHKEQTVSMHLCMVPHLCNLICALVIIHAWMLSRH